jgi:hypothetical protein
VSVTAKLYSNYPHLLQEDALAGSILTQTIKVALVTSSYTFNQETHDYFDDITNEVSGTGYTAGGATLASKTNTETTRVTTFDAADTTWTSSTITARGAVVYYASGTASTSLLIAFIDFGADKSSDNGTFQITWNASGIFTVTVAA